MQELIATHRPDLVVIACNTASTLVLPVAARALRAALRRHRAGDQAGLRRLAIETGLRARHRGNRRARIHPRADPQFRRRLRSHAGRIGPACGAGRSVACGRARSTRRRSAPRSRPASSRTARRAPTPSCSPARIIRCCCSASSASRRGRCAGSIRRPRSRGASSSWSGPRAGEPHRDLAPAIFTAGKIATAGFAAALQGFGLAPASAQPLPAV